MADRSVSVSLRANVAGFVAGMKTAQGSVSSFTRELETNAKRKQALLSVGNAAGTVGLAFGALTIAAGKSAADFDKAMSSVQAATHESGRAMESLRQAALKAGADTSFSATEAAGGIEALSKAGVTTSDILRGGLKGALDLAAAGTIDVQDAAEAAASAMSQFGLRGQDVPHVADLLAAAAGKAQGEVGDFSQALNQAGLVANQTGLTIEETMGSLAAFASKGLIGSDAGTSFKTFLQNLTPSSTKAKELMDELGVSAYDAQGNFIGLSKYAGVLRDGLSGLSVEQRNAAMKTIFGSDSVRAATVLYDEGAAGIQRWTNKVNDQGFAAETAAIKLDNLSGDLEALKGSLETALIGTGESGMGPLRQLTQGATAAVNAFNDLPGPVKTAAFWFGALATAAGGATFLGTRFLASVAEARIAMAELGWTAKGTTTALRAVGTGMVIAGVVYGASKLDEVLRDIGNVELGSGLTKDLDNLGRSGKVSGALLDTFGKDLGGLDANITTLENPVNRVSDALSTLVPGKSTWDIATENIGKVDAALTQLAAGGKADQAKDAFNRLAAAAKRDGTTMAELEDRFPKFTSWLDKSAREARKGVGATDRHAGAVEDDADAVENETSALEDNIKAHNRRTDTLLADIDKTVAWEQSVDDAAKEARKGARSLNLNTQAGRDNLTTLTDMAAAWNDLPDKTKRAEGGIKEARQEFIRIAEQMGASKKRAQELARELLDIPNPKRKVEVDTEGARRNVESFTGWFNNVMTTDLKDEDVKINVDSSILQLAAQGQGPLQRATGGPITGGVAGKDSVHILGMPGEHVFTKSDVDKAGGQRAMFAIRKMIQRGEFAKKGDLQYMASGGPVVRMPVREHGLEHVIDVAQAQADALSALVGKRLSDRITQMYQFGGNGRPLGPGGTLSMGQALKGQQFAQTQAGKPYQWGGTGNPSWDCSGFVGGVLLASLGQSPYHRIGSTASMPWPGFSPGAGIFTTGTDPGSHMDGNVGGMGIESRGGDGIVLGGGITPISSFARMDHYDNGGVWPAGAVGMNMSGRDELVLNNEQARRFFGSPGGGRGSSSSSRGPVRVVVDMGGQTFRGMMYDAADDLFDARESHSRRMAGMR